MKHPYEDIAPYRSWRSAMSNQGPGLVDPVTTTKFAISREDRVATLGSCFAQHISRFLVGSGFNFYVPEQAPADAPHDVAQSYGVFSARYGNVYTVRQALQLAQEAFGDRASGHLTWERDGRHFDPLRPSAHPGGFASVKEVRSDRKKHLGAVRKVIQESDVVVFTLGLTEAWVSLDDGSVLPSAPGVIAGTYDPRAYEFHNFTSSEVTADLRTWCLLARDQNPDLRVLLTVSPVALAATAEERHVWTSTTYSKAVLRAAAGEVSTELDFVDYFPSYEVITSPSAGGRFYADDLRQVTEQGVQHVMALFKRHYLSREAPAASIRAAAATRSTSPIDDGSGILCDDDLIF